MSSDIQRLRGFARGIGYFWLVVAYGSLVVMTAAIFITSPSLLREPRGWLQLGLTLAFALWYWYGWRFVRVGKNNDNFWRERLSNRGFSVRGVVFWAGLLGLALLLSSFNQYYGYLLWIAFGVSLAVVAMPWALLLTVPTAVLMFAVLGWFPQSASAGEVLGFLGGIIGFTVYTVVIYLPFALLKGRFEREQVYAELARSHQELEEAHRQLAESAQRDRALAVLRERGRLARDMHDTLGHSLALITVKLEAAQRLRPVDAARADHEILATQTIAREALADLRTAIADLRAPLLSLEPLSEILSRTARESGARAGWQVNYEISPEVGTLDERIYEALLRVGTEALANAERHAHARTLTLHLEREGCEVLLRVRDDGLGILATNPPEQRMPATVAVAVGSGGISPSNDSSASAASTFSDISSPNGHYGITGMRERIAALGGHFIIGPDCDGHGTVVEARVPAE
ncbi:MAG TPA: sensor histidine kinase [Ktedonobacterales bacterium]|nr:sensor histidine kinase [Ktedonobacterales bacterium]